MCLSGNKRRLITRAVAAGGSLGIYLCGHHRSAPFRSRTPTGCEPRRVSRVCQDGPPTASLPGMVRACDWIGMHWMK
jgi:hypothetical protein